MAHINAPSAVQVRLIEYFWNSRAARHRLSLSIEVLSYLESDSRSREFLALTPLDVVVDILKTLEALVRRGFVDVTIDSTDSAIPRGEVRLTDIGAAFLAQRHPTYLARWQRLLETSPPLASFFTATVGLIASVFGIIQFIDWLRH
jgi:hypothetical protein